MAVGDVFVSSDINVWNTNFKTLTASLCARNTTLHIDELTLISMNCVPMDEDRWSSLSNALQKIKAKKLFISCGHVPRGRSLHVSRLAASVGLACGFKYEIRRNGASKYFSALCKFDGSVAKGATIQVGDGKMLW